MELRQFVCQLVIFILVVEMEQIGEILDVPYYMHTSIRRKHLQIVIDVIDGIGNSFSLESAKDKSFIIRAKKIGYSVRKYPTFISI